MKTLLTGGTLLTWDPAVGVLEPGDVLIENGDVLAAADALSARVVGVPTSGRG